MSFRRCVFWSPESVALSPQPPWSPSRCPRRRWDHGISPASVHEVGGRGPRVNNKPPERSWGSFRIESGPVPLGRSGVAQGSCSLERRGGENLLRAWTLGFLGDAGRSRGVARGPPGQSPRPCPRRSEERPRKLREAAQTVHERSESPKDRSKTPRWPPDGPKGLHDAPRGLPREPEEGKIIVVVNGIWRFLGFSRSRLAEAPRPPKRPRILSQNGPKGAQDGPQTAQEGPKTVPEASTTACEGGPERTFRG